MPILGVHGQIAAEQTNSVPEVYVAAILSEIAIHRAPTIPDLKRICDVVFAEVLATGWTDRLVGGSDHGLRESALRNNECDAEECSGESHRRNLASAFEPWIRTWHVVQF